MKVFEEYWEKYIKKYPTTFYPILNTFKPFAKIFWKGALEWAKKQLRTDVNGYFNIIKELEKK